MTSITLSASEASAWRNPAARVSTRQAMTWWGLRWSCGPCHALRDLATLSRKQREPSRATRIRSRQRRGNRNTLHTHTTEGQKFARLWERAAALPLTQVGAGQPHDQIDGGRRLKKTDSGLASPNALYSLFLTVRWTTFVFESLLALGLPVAGRKAYLAINAWPPC